MLKFFSQHKRIFSNLCLIFLLSILGIFVFRVQSAHAAWSVFDIVAKVLSVVSAIIRSIASLFFYAASILLDLSFGLETFTKAGIVQTGWQLTRDLVNMFFVLVLLVIAFGLILQQENYGSKKILGRLVIIALLINFSLVICGVIIDSSQVVTHFFYDEAAGGLSAQLGNAFNVQKTVQLPEGKEGEEIAKNFAAGIGGSINITFSILIGTLLIIIATITVAAGAFFMIVRMIQLWISMIFVPLAWFAWILPGTAHFAKDWWKNFLKWVFFAPTYTFFLWLAIKASQGGTFENAIQQGVNNTATASGFMKTLGFAFTPAVFMQFCLVIGLLIGGLMFASKSGVYGSKAVMGFVGAGGKKAKDFAKTRAQSYVGRKAAPVAEKWAQGGFVKRQAARLFTGAQETGRSADQAAVKQYEEKYKNYTDENKRRELSSIVATPYARVAIAKLLAEKGGLKAENGVTDEIILKTLKTAKKFGAQKDILKVRPDLAKSIGEDVNKIIAGLKPQDMEKLQAVSLDNKDVIAAIRKQLTTGGGKWNKNHLAKLDENNFTAFEKIRDNIIKELVNSDKDWDETERVRPDMTGYLTSDLGKALFSELPLAAKKK